MQDDSTSFSDALNSVFESSTLAVDSCARDISAVIDSCTKSNIVCRLAFCGGTAARLVIKRLTELHSNFEGVEFYLTDERCVAVGDPDRNDQLLIELLVDTGLVSGDAIHSIPAELGAVSGASKYTTIVSSFTKFDAIFLSIGDDGHVASIFPHHPTVDAKGVAIAVQNAPKSPSERVSLTLDTMRAASHRFVMGIGEKKSNALARIHSGWDPPAVRVEPTRWYLDRAALHDIRG